VKDVKQHSTSLIEKVQFAKRIIKSRYGLGGGVLLLVNEELNALLYRSSSLNLSHFYKKIKIGIVTNFFYILNKKFTYYRIVFIG
jgi:hypothetical protein